MSNSHDNAPPKLPKWFEDAVRKCVNTKPRPDTMGSRKASNPPKKEDK